MTQWRKMRLYQSHEDGSYSLLWVVTAGTRVMWEVRHLLKEDVFTIRRCNRRIYSIVGRGAGKWYLGTKRPQIVLAVSRRGCYHARYSVLSMLDTGMRKEGCRYRGYLQKRRYRYAQLEVFRPT